MSVKTNYRPDIQGLRALAVTLVVLAHTKVPGFAGGFIGVDVFFVLSGYLITGLLLDERISTGSIGYGRFLARRLRRLLPALLVMLVSVLVIASLLLSAYETRMQSGSFLFSATWTSNLFFAFVDRDYFSALQSEDLFLHTWSLGVEEQFYIVWPWLLSLTCLFAATRNRPNNLRTVLLAALASIFVLSLLLCLYWSATQPLLSFYMMPARGWQFALGASVYVWFLGTNRVPTGRTPMGIIGVVLILGSASLLSPDTNYPGYFAILPSVGAALLIAAGVGTSTGGMSALLASKPFVWLGDRSYSLYLWHWPLIILGNSLGISSSGFGIAGIIVISIFLAILSYRYVELPYWKGSLSTATPLRTLALSITAVVAVVGVSEGLKRGVYSATPAATFAENYDPRWDASPAVYTKGLNCDTGHFSAQVIPCAIGAREGEKLAVLLGDSIGAQWSTLVTSIFPAPDWQVLVLTKSACAMVDEDYFYDKVGANYDVCTEWRNTALEYIAAINPDVVIVGSGSYYDFSPSQWLDGSARVLSDLSAAADQVVVIPGIPELTFDGPSCLEEPYRFSFRLRGGMRECEEGRFDSTSEEVATYLRQATAGIENTHVLEFVDLVCPNNRCAASTENGIVVFRDASHLTMTFVNAQVGEARRRLLAMGVRGM